MAKEPLLPGFVFEQTQGKNFHLNQNFNVINGFNLPRVDSGQLSEPQLEPSFCASLEFQPSCMENDYIRHNLQEDYIRNKKLTKKTFIPHYVTHDGKCLSFRGYFKEQVPEYSQKEHQLLYRRVNIIYYLEDNTMTIIEPSIPNSGYHQGRLVRRGKIPKPNSSELWHWKDLNIGVDMEAYGIVYHICSCDAFTQDYLSSQGIEINKSEEIPDGILRNHTTNHRDKYALCDHNAHREQMPFSEDKLYKFLQYDRKVLRFYACWREKDDDINTDIIRYKIYYYLIDDTVEIRESPTRFLPEQLFKRFLRRTTLPKNYERGPANNLILSYTSDHREYYQPKDFLIGTYIHVLGRKFFLHDCDDFTRTYFRECLKIEQSAPIDIPVPNSHPQPVIKEIAPHTGIGQPEDTLQSCLSIIPKPPRKNVIHYVENANKYLRYSVKLDSNIEDKEREFIMQYSLAEGKISIYENRVPNSGFTPGYFLKSALVPKVTVSSSSSHKPEYYTPDDFIIGKAILIFGRKFLITGADLAVLRYMESNQQKFGAEALISVREYLKRKRIINDVNDESAPIV